MRKNIFISLLCLIILLVFSCEKQNDNAFIDQKSMVRNQSSNLLVDNDKRIEQAIYYKDSVRVAFLIRAKNVLSRHSGYELIESKFTKTLEYESFSDKETCIEQIRNKKDSLFIKVFFKSKSEIETIQGIEYKDGDVINLLCERYHLINSEKPVSYFVEYTILKRKWLRLNFQFNGHDIPIVSGF